MLPANCEYSRSNREKLPLPIQIKLSKKTKDFLPYFFDICGIYSKLPISWSKNVPLSSSISEVIHSERCAYLKA